MSTLRQRIEQRITDLRVERAIAAAAASHYPGPWVVEPASAFHGPDAEGFYVTDERDLADDDPPMIESRLYEPVAAHIATQDPATTIARIDRELAGCAADLALLGWLDESRSRLRGGGSATKEELVVGGNLNARYPGGDS